MPEVVLADGLTWEWESFPQFIAALERRAHDIDFAVQLPHAALRMYVMGERAADGAIATDEDIDWMRRLAQEAVAAGAVGFGTSRSIFHTSTDGAVIPTAHTPAPELRAIALGTKDAGGSAIQAILNVQAPLAALEMFCRISAETGCPFSFSLLQVLGAAPNSWRALLESTEQANRRGIQVTAQVYPRPVGVLLGLDASYHPFSAYPAYLRIAHLPLCERVAQIRKPEVPAAILSDQPEPRGMLFYYTARSFDTISRSAIRRTTSRLAPTASPPGPRLRASQPTRSP
jgi:N-acyl-D-amino-acid deacylase